MALDLTFARQVVRDTVLVDLATVIRELPGPHGAVFNDVTGMYENADADSITLGTNVPCKVRDDSDIVKTTPGRHRELTYTVTFAYDALPTLEVGDVVRLTTSQEPRLVGVDLRITKIIESSLRVSRRAIAVRRAHADTAGD